MPSTKITTTDPAVFDRYEDMVIRDWRVQSDPALGPCWGWRGPVDGEGYALLSVRNVRVRAARWVYRQTRGRINGPVLTLVCHERSTACRGGSTCPHRCCTNPAHWQPGTRAVGARRQARMNPYRQRRPVD
jgi:hypothetical protein